MKKPPVKNSAKPAPKGASKAAPKKAPPKAAPKRAPAGPRMTPGPVDPGMGGSGGMGMAPGPGSLPQLPGMGMPGMGQ